MPTSCVVAPAPLFTKVIAYALSLGHSYASFYAGITNDPDRRKAEHGNPPSWRCWKAASARIAAETEKMLHDSGMQGGGGGSSEATYVYVLLTHEDRERRLPSWLEIR